MRDPDGAVAKARGAELAIAYKLADRHAMKAQ